MPISSTRKAPRARRLALRMAAALGLLVIEAPAHAQDAAMFILDASGSMWGRVEGQTKIEAARDVMGKLVSEVPDNVEVGLIAYGHRRKGDCADIEVVQRPSAGAGATIADRLGRLVPRGKTPISDALVAGTEALAFRGGRRSVVLVSDGIETCSADPCAVAQTLAEANVDLKIHVVGFDVDEAARRQLQCIADKGRGRYFPADNAFELASALTTVTTSIATAEPIAEPEPEPVVEVPAPPTVAPTTTTKIKIAGPGTVEVAPAPWVTMPPRYWALVDPETGELITKTKEASIKAKPGLYQIAWRQVEHGSKDVALSEVIEVAAGARSLVKVDTGLRLVAPEGMEKPEYWQLVASDEELALPHYRREFVAHYEVWDPVPVPAGQYSLVLRQTEHGHSEVNLGPVRVEGGKLTDVMLDQGISLQWPEEWDTATGKTAIEYLRVTDAKGNEMRFRYRGPVILPPGTYHLTFRLEQHGWADVDWGDVTVPEAGFVDPKINSGITFLSKDQAKHTIWAINLDTQRETLIERHWGPMALPAGRYRIDYQPERGQRYTIVEELPIGESEMIEAEM